MKNEEMFYLLCERLESIELLTKSCLANQLASYLENITENDLEDELKQIIHEKGFVIEKIENLSGQCLLYIASDKKYGVTTVDKVIKETQKYQEEYNFVFIFDSMSKKQMDAMISREASFFCRDKIYHIRLD